MRWSRRGVVDRGPTNHKKNPRYCQGAPFPIEDTLLDVKASKRNSIQSRAADATSNTIWVHETHRIQNASHPIPETTPADHETVHVRIRAAVLGQMTRQAQC
jgi:hypothetical protein